MLQTIALIVFAIFAVIGTILSLFGIGGTFLVLTGALFYNLITWSMTIKISTLIWITSLAILGEIIEWMITINNRKHITIGLVVGAIIGGMLFSFIPIIGTIIGLILGATIGAYLAEYLHSRNLKHASKEAKKAIKQRMSIGAVKTILVIVQIVLILRDIF